MKIKMIKPSPIAITESGSQTERYLIGEELESNDSWMILRMQDLVKTGKAVEIGGKQAPVETKKRATKAK